MPGSHRPKTASYFCCSGLPLPCPASHWSAATAGSVSPGGLGASSEPGCRLVIIFSIANQNTISQYFYNLGLSLRYTIEILQTIATTQDVGPGPPKYSNGRDQAPWRRAAGPRLSELNLSVAAGNGAGCKIATRAAKKTTARHATRRAAATVTRQFAAKQ